MDYIFLKSTKKNMEEYGTIYIRIRTNKFNKKYSTGITLKEYDWLKYRSLQYVSSHLISYLGIKYGQLALILTQIKTALEDDFDPDTATAIIRSIKSNIINGGKLYVKEKKKDKTLLVPYMEQYALELQTGARQKNGTAQKVSKGHIHNINATIKYLKKYEISRRVELSLDDVTMDFQRDFVKWLSDNGIHCNTIRGTFSRIHTILAIAFNEKLTEVDDFRNPQFLPKAEEVDHIYLTKEQIDIFFKIDLSSPEIIKKHIEQAKLKTRQKGKAWWSNMTENLAKQIEISRDEFIIGCLTGQRVSDYQRINSEMLEDLDNMKFISLIQKKTGKRVYIPMDKRVMFLLKKYDGALPHVNITRFNRNLKFIGELLGWTYNAKIDESRMGGKTSTRFCDLISSHTARRTFATIAYSNNVPLMSIMAITGHTTERSLRKYLKLKEVEKAIIAAKDLAGVIQA